MNERAARKLGQTIILSPLRDGNWQASVETSRGAVFCATAATMEAAIDAIVTDPEVMSAVTLADMASVRGAGL